LLSPVELRLRARKSLESAALLLPSDPDKAAYLAGEAAELLLKARYCALRGLSGLPSDRKALRKLKLDTHQLEQLMKFSDRMQLDWHAMDAIDWPTVTEWDNEDRYSALGSIAPDKSW
jgi:HEPN domain-containing protein